MEAVIYIVAFTSAILVLANLHRIIKVFQKLLRLNGSST